MRLGLIVLAIAFAMGCTSPANPGVAYLAPQDAGLGLEGIATPDSVVADDDAIAISPHGLDLVGNAGMPQSMPISVTGAGGVTTLVSFEWSGDTTGTFSVMPPAACSSTANPTNCPVMPPNTVNPGMVAAMVTCMPSATPRSATLKAISNVTGIVDSITVTCKEPVTNPSFTIPNSLAVSAQVNDMAGDFVRVTNDGDTTLNITAELDPNDTDSTEWQAGPICVTAPCTIIAGGHQDIPVSLHPTHDGAIDTLLIVQSTAPVVGPKSTQLEGTGLGGKLRVDDPDDPFEHDFGTIARDQTAVFTVAMTNIGNQDIAVQPTTPAAPFGIVIASPPPPIAITKNNGMATFDITCLSATPLSEQSATIGLAVSMNTYDQNTDHIDVHCAVANTTIQVTNPLDFGELRVGAPEGVIDVAITNPAGGGDVTIMDVRLAGAPSALTLDAVAVPATLPDTMMIATKLRLSTLDEVTSLGDAKLEVVVVESGNTVTLSLPVTGKVGTASAVVTPAVLELGSVCVGTAVDGQITMTNTGTLTLLMQRPTMDSPTFVPLYNNPTDYPMGGALLLPGDKAMTGVMPATDAKGLLEGTLEWPVDVEAGKFDIPITLRVLDMGTAVSPARQIFGSYDIDNVMPMPQTVRIENCGPDAAEVSYNHVDATQGKANAWVLDPPDQQRTLLPGEEMRVRVSFVPRVPGAHVATLPIGIGGDETDVLLEGDATGTLPEVTSFYACNDCNSSGAPTRGWPLIAAVVLILRRRRKC